MTDSLVIDALHKAIALRQPPPSLIHHSDRGGHTPATTIAPSSAELLRFKA